VFLHRERTGVEELGSGKTDFHQFGEREREQLNNKRRELKSHSTEPEELIDKGKQSSKGNTQTEDTECVYRNGWVIRAIKKKNGSQISSMYAKSERSIKEELF
jgi:hypothetical protein